MAEENTAILGGGSGPVSQFAGDMNAGVAFFLDFVVNMFVLAGILAGGFGMPVEYVFGKIIPGAIMGILIGNLLMYWVRRETEARTGNEKLTSVPLGIDLPTVFGMAFFIVGPTYVLGVDSLGSEAAANQAWIMGMAATFWMAGIKFILSFFSRIMQHGLPQMALIGAMAGIATVWLGAEAIYGIFELPEIGILSLAIMAFALIAGHKLPMNLPGAIIAIVIGTGIYYIIAGVGTVDGYVIKEMPAITPALPMPTLAGLFAVFGSVTNYLGIIMPFALLIAASGVNVVAGAKVLGDDYDAVKVMRLDAVATAISALFGGVVQTTPYFGHATYRRMGARSNYALGAAFVVTAGGLFGVIAFASQLIPAAVLKPILVVVASDILRLTFTGGDVRHAPALLFAIVPVILNYSYTKVSDLYGRIGEAAQQALSQDWVNGYILLGVMSRGYILTSLIWASMVVWIIDRKMTRAAGAAFTAALCTKFGIIHSVLGSSGMYLPWNMPELGGVELLVDRVAMGYLIAGVMLLAFGQFKNDEASEISS
ncbi:MAG: hypothetical protein JKY34_02130 [Kordiimonadaceae bacterium]|nr:hypothetical protein [Kordiimonadaceae bacterium]